MEGLRNNYESIGTCTKRLGKTEETSTAECPSQVSYHVFPGFLFLYNIEAIIENPTKSYTTECVIHLYYLTSGRQETTIHLIADMQIRKLILKTLFSFSRIISIFRQSIKVNCFGQYVWSQKFDY